MYKSRSLLSDFLLKLGSQAGFTVLIVYIFTKTSRFMDIGYISVAMLLPSLFFTAFFAKILHHFSALFTYRISLLLRSGIRGFVDVNLHIPSRFLWSDQCIRWLCYYGNCIRSKCNLLYALLL